MQFSSIVENSAVFCKFNKLTKGDDQQVPACMSRVCVWQDDLARGRVGGKGKDEASLFDGAVLFIQLTKSDHCDCCQFRTLYF